MFSKEQFDWVEFYKEFAQKLLNYKTNRKELISIVESVYKDTGINLPTLEIDNNIIDIDPFTIFGLFNKGITKENRLKIMSDFATKLNIQAKLPTSFDSIPVLNNQNATFYYFTDLRADNDIDDLWCLFESALNYSYNQTQDNKNILSYYFDVVINKKGNGNSKITMGLYWIAPNTFLNLDSRNEWYIYESGKMPQSLINTLPQVEPKISSKKYFEIVEKLREFLSNNNGLKDFNELSFEAWRFSEEVNQQRKQEQMNEDIKNNLEDDKTSVHYWIYSPGDNANKWDEFYNNGIMGIGWDEIGDIKNYSSKEDIKNALKEKRDPSLTYKNVAHALWQFAQELKPGDIVFVKKGMHTLVGRGIVESNYFYDENRNEYKHICKVNWTHNGEWNHPGQAVMKVLTDITQYTDYVKKLLEIVNSDDSIEQDQKEQKYEAYTKDDFLSDIYMTNESYNNLIRLLENKKNIILQGAPGVGKTYIAKRLAYSIIGEKNTERVNMVQFHQSYSYEDFIMGFRPNSTGFELKTGVFYNFCKEAENDEENKYFFIIDEINRGNLSKIFGELFMLIENDKRKNTSIQLVYNGEKFSVPKNVYIIGMMNTADRSLAMLDYALRRRFAFYDIIPGFNTDGFKKYQESIENHNFNNLINCVRKLNEVISNDETLGNGFCIGHSYFCNLSKNVSDKELIDIVEFELIPLIKEYWFDEQSKVNEWTLNLRSSIK